MAILTHSDSVLQLVVDWELLVTRRVPLNRESGVMRAYLRDIAVRSVAKLREAIAGDCVLRLLRAAGLRAIPRAV